MKNIFKTFLSMILGVLLILSAVACNYNQSGNNSPSSDYTRPSDVNIDNSFTPTGKTLVAYFSKTNTTKGVAETIQELTDADIFEIERKEPYPTAYTPTTEVAKKAGVTVESHIFEGQPHGFGAGTANSNWIPLFNTVLTNIFANK